MISNKSDKFDDCYKSGRQFVAFLIWKWRETHSKIHNQEKKGGLQ